MLIRILFLLLFFSNTLNAQLIHFQGKDRFINGVNIPWNNFGWDFGVHPDWGNGYDSLYFENTFTDLEANGVNCIRMWIHCDGRANPNFDADGFVTGLDIELLDQLNDFTERAARHNLMIVFTLWSHDMLEDRTDDAGEFAGLHQDLILEENKTQSYLDNALLPIVQALNHHCNILAWEIFSEPEWCMRILGGGYTKETVHAEAMQTFIGKCIATIRANSSHQITVGSAYPCGNDYGLNKNYWHETEFERMGFNCEEVNVDFYSFHYFEWMNDNENVFEQNFDYWDVNKPILIAETAVQTESIDELPTGEEQLNHALDNDYAGILFWSHNAQDEYSQWDELKESINDFSFGNPDLTGFENDCSLFEVNSPSLVCRFYPNPTAEQVFLEHHFETETAIRINIFDANGRLVQQFEETLFPNQMNLEYSLSKLQSGVYFFEINQKRAGEYFRIFGQRIIKI